jgi:hypothetical protein
MNLRCECADDDDYREYMPSYVETYLNNRESDQQTIQDWTDTEGFQFFPAGEIYRPVDLPIAITGSEANAFEVDMTRPEWRAQLQTAVESVVTSAGLAKASDKVELHNVRREPLGDKVRCYLVQGCQPHSHSPPVNRSIAWSWSRLACCT